MRFTIEVDAEWLDTLKSLTALVAGQEKSSPEAALEQAIFAQLKEQWHPKALSESSVRRT